jgi:acetyltransferase-like isoleucine patch superfamily enzyme
VNPFFRQCRRWVRRQAEARQASRLRRAHVGPHSYLDASVQVLGWQQVRIGHHTVVSADTWINVNDRAVSTPTVIIGNNCFLGRRNFISVGALIRLGDYCFTGVDCHFLGADHDYSSPFQPYVTSRVISDGVIDVGANCWFGSSVIVLKNVRIGFGSVLGAGSVITHDVPPMSVVVGSPGRVVRRFDMRSSAWVKSELYTEAAERELPAEAEYLAGLRAKFPDLRGPLAVVGPDFGDL